MIGIDLVQIGSMLVKMDGDLLGNVKITHITQWVK
jgi:hypothetical protein